MARAGAALSWAGQGRRGYILAIGAVAIALLARLALEPFGRFYYLPLIPAVILPALLASRGATLLAIVLSISANVALVPRESTMDAVVNALLFAAVGVAISEIGRAQRAILARSYALKVQLSRRDATLEAMLASANVLTVDARGRVLSISGRAAGLFGVAPAQAVGRPVEDLIEGFDASQLGEDVVPTNGVIHTWKGRRSNGATFPIGVRGARSVAEDAAPELVLMLTDLSLWHSAEARNQELNDQLSHVWRLNSLGEMAAILSHELNQPLTAAATYLHGARTDMQRAGTIGDSAILNLDLAKNQVLRAGGIIRRARQLLTVEGQTLQPESVSSMLDDLQPILRLLGPAANVRIGFGIDIDDDKVLADRIQFQQAIVNLVRNAVEAAGVGGGRGKVRIIGRPLSHQAFEVRVEDSGPGVGDDQMSTLFRPLTSTKSDGMGLGLSVTRSIVERHGGVLRMEHSDLGGAAFVFELKRAVDEHQNREAA